MTVWLLVALGVAVASAMLPLVSVEVFLLTLVSDKPWLPCLWLGLVIGVGQVAGKLLYFYAARGSITLPPALRARLKSHRERTDRGHPRWVAAKTRCRYWYRMVRVLCRRHRRWMVGTHTASSLVGVPPFMATTVLAGLAGMSLTLFLTTGLTGRVARFTALAASPGLLASWWG